MPWHYDPGAGIFRPPSPHGHSSDSHSNTRTNVSGSGRRGRPLEILHPPNDCTHCHAYKVHVMLACLQDDAAFEQDCSSECNRHLPHPDPELSQTKAKLRRVRQERDEAVAFKVYYQHEVAELKKQVRELKDRLFTIGIVYGDDIQLRDVWSSDEERENRYDGFIPTEAEQDDDVVQGNLADDLGMDEPWTIESPIDQNDASDDFDTFQQIHLMTLNPEVEWTSWESDDQQEIPQDSTLENCTDSSSESHSSTSSSSLLSESDLAGNESDDLPPSPPPPPTKPTLSSDEELHQTLKLMASAHEVGNTTALAEVKKLILQAEKTPRHNRTKAQNYILLNWRSPGSSSRNATNNCQNSASSSHLQPLAPIYSIPSSLNGPEMFVDASPSGIGFVFKTQWLAWTFKKTPKIPLGSDGRVVMSWAELLAVELGLRALITAGYRSTNITIRSDNTGVIDALKKKTWCPRYGIEEMLQNILSLCGEYRIQLRPSWISTKMNPADKPSRGIYPPSSLFFKFQPNLPKRLLCLLKPAVLPTV